MPGGQRLALRLGDLEDVAAARRPEIVEALEADDVKGLGAVKSLKRRKRALADGFRAFRAG